MPESDKRFFIMKRDGSVQEFDYDAYAAELDLDYIEDIFHLVCRHYGASPEDMFAASHQRAVVQARRMGIYLAQKRTDCSLSAIGRRFAGGSDTAVLFAIRSVERDLAKNVDLLDEVRELTRQVDQQGMLP